MSLVMFKFMVFTSDLQTLNDQLEGHCITVLQSNPNSYTSLSISINSKKFTKLLITLLPGREEQQRGENYGEGEEEDELEGELAKVPKEKVAEHDEGRSRKGQRRRPRSHRCQHPPFSGRYPRRRLRHHRLPIVGDQDSGEKLGQRMRPLLIRYQPSISFSLRSNPRAQVNISVI